MDGVMTVIFRSPLSVWFRRYRIFSSVCSSLAVRLMSHAEVTTGQKRDAQLSEEPLPVTSNSKTNTEAGLFFFFVLKLYFQH